MKRWLYAGVVLIVLLVACVYFFIPSRLVVTKIVSVDCNRDGAGRVLGDTVGWIRWWPRTGTSGPDWDGDQLLFRGAGYKVARRLHRGADIVIDDGGREIPSELAIFPLNNIDSSYLQWQFTQQTSLNPLRRIGQYQAAKRIKGDMAVILDSLRSYLDDPMNVYGVAIVQASTKDSFLVETTRAVKGYPGTGTIYGIVKFLEAFAHRRGGVRTGYPMLNIDPLEGGSYRLKMAIPVDRELRDSGDVVFRKLVKGQYLESDVRGGPGAINAALGRIDNYIADHQRTVMAIPFFSLVTDRTVEPDSAKWVTRIYYPIY